MKNMYIRLAVCLAGAFIVLLMTGCTKEKTTEIRTVETVKDTTLMGTCGGDISSSPCHNPNIDTLGYYVSWRVSEWRNSGHAVAANASGEWENGGGCQACHTRDGYIQQQNGVAVTATSGTSPDCFACHDPHSKGNFDLRATTPVTLASNIKGVAASTFDYGAGGNLCVSCHHPRTLNPLPPNPSLPDGNDTVTTSVRWYPHVGVQGQMLMGAGGYEFNNGTNYFPTQYYHGNNAAIKQDGCPLCHMATPATRSSGVGELGGHTMHLDEIIEGTDTKLVSACNVAGCHASLTTFDHNGKVTAVQAYMDTLKTLLVAKGWIDTANSIKTVKITPARRSGALFNYLFVLHDGSNGVHNAEYAIALLQNSLVEIRK
jgi:hypothetical protein